MKKRVKLLSLIISATLLLTSVSVVPFNALSEQKNLLWSDSNFEYSYSFENTYAKKFSKIVVNKKDLGEVIDVTDTAVFNCPEFDSAEKPKCAVNGHADSWAFGDDMFKLAPKTGYDSVGVLIDLGDIYNVCNVVTKTVTQNVSSDWAKEVRKIKGKVYVGNSIASLAYSGEFNNTDNTVSVIESQINDKTGRYVVIVYSDMVLYSGSLWIDEIEVFGTECVIEGHSNLLLGNRNAISKLEMKNAIDINENKFNAELYKSSWISNNYENVGSAVDGDTTTCSSTTGFKPTYQYSEGGESKLYANIGWLIDLGSSHDFSSYKTYYWTDNSKIDTRKQKGVIFAGNDSENLVKVADFENAGGKLSLDVNLSGVSARYVAVVITNQVGADKGFNWYTLYRTFMAEIELYGVKTPEPEMNYNLNFNVDDGVVCDEESRVVSNKVPLENLPQPSKDGKIFVGWFDENNNRISEGDFINQDTNAYAKFGVNFATMFTPNKLIANSNDIGNYKLINFATDEYYSAIINGNKLSENGTYLHSSVLAFGKEDGYDCVGMFYDLGGYYSVDNLKLYLCPDAETDKSDWKKLLRNVAGEIYVGDTPEGMQKVAEFNHTDTQKAEVSVDIAGASGRYVSVVFTSFYFDINIKKLYLYEMELIGDNAPLKENQCKVKFDYGEDIYDGGSELERRINKGDALGEVPKPVKIGYTLDGWYLDLNDDKSKITENDTFEENTVLYAKWTKQENLILGKLGAKLVAPKGKLDEFVISRYNGTEFHQAEVSGRFRANDGDRGGALMDALPLDVSYNTEELVAGLMYDLGAIYDISSFACFQNFSGFHMARLIRGMRIYVGDSFYDLCDDSNLVAEVDESSNLIKYFDISEKNIRGRFVVFFFTEPSTNPDVLNSAPVGGKHDPLDDDGTVAYIHELEVYGQRSNEMPQPTYQNVILTKSPEVYVAKGGKLDAVDMEKAVFASGVESYMTLDYTRVNELNVEMKRLYTNGYSYSFTNAFGDDGDLVVYKFELDGVTDIHKIKCGYNWAAPEKMSWDVYISETEEDLFNESNKFVGKQIDGTANFVLDFAKKGKYVAFVVSIIDRYKSSQVSTLEIYAGEKLPMHNVQFEYDGATSAITETNRVVPSGKGIGTLPLPRKKDLEFLGWNTKSDGKGNMITEDYAITEALTLYAIWGEHKLTKEYLYPLEDEDSGVKADIHLNGYSDVMTTFAKLSVAKNDSSKYDSFGKGLNDCYYIHDTFDIDFTDVLGESVDIEGRRVTIYLPISEKIADKTISVAVSYGDEIEIMPCDIINGYAVFETNVISSFALVEPNFKEGATEQEVKEGKYSEKPTSLFHLGWWKNFFK